ncbi:ATP-binding protein [Bradyrhizobium ottawaense]|uniref:ATP-binding protein n=1 Tax=Bradyrhizobium ottawaense TaxID=931866 RepID=UPI003F9F34DB
MAISDMIDNSITEGAETTQLDASWNDGDPVPALLDDGSGMNRGTLAAALRFNGLGPLAARSQFHLGRFGLGLKTASLSQCHRPTIISRRHEETSGLVLDVDVTAERGWYASS